MDDRPGGMTENQTDLPPTKEKQEKALTLFCVKASHNCPQCGQFQGVDGGVPKTKFFPLGVAPA